MGSDAKCSKKFVSQVFKKVQTLPEAQVVAPAIKDPI